jgi:hypothetical protein
LKYQLKLIIQDLTPYAFGEYWCTYGKRYNLIVDVEPGEAKLLIGLIKTLINDWYIVKHNREESMRQIIDSAKNKNNKNTK